MNLEQAIRNLQSHRMDNAYEFDLELKTIKENCSGRTAELTRKHAERALGNHIDYV